jgi:hypothetical protein
LRTLDGQLTECYATAVSIQQEDDDNPRTIAYYFNQYWRLISVAQEYSYIEKQIAVLHEGLRPYIQGTLKGPDEFGSTEKLLKAAQGKEASLNRLKTKIQRSSDCSARVDKTRTTLSCCTLELLWKMKLWRRLERRMGMENAHSV